MKTNPSIILVRPQLGENIGAVARAMANFSLGDLRLVAPRVGWDGALARKVAKGAEYVIDACKIYDTTQDSLADLSYVVAVSARPRDMVKPSLMPEHLVSVLIEKQSQQLACGLMFGPEKAGLNNEDVSLADSLCRIPTNADFSSLNLAQSVLLLSYLYFRECHHKKSKDKHQGKHQVEGEVLSMRKTRPAKREEWILLFNHLENALDAAGFLAPPEKKPAMMRNIRNTLLRAQLTEQDIRTCRGIINALLRWPRDVLDHQLRARVREIAKGKKESEEPEL